MHVSLYVQDIQRTIDFYTRFFGQVPSKVRHAYAKWELAEPGLIISFVENPDRVQAHFGHLGIQVGSAQALTERLAAAKSAGLDVREEMGTACCYAQQDKFWVADPDGAQWEVYLFHEDVEWNDPHYALDDASACCMPSTAIHASAQTVMAAEPLVSQPVAAPAKPKVSLADLKSQACTPGGGCC
jgi:catechol 2,3-dioxygenase-like lactoylglutathione lyase family enzyme